MQFGAACGLLVGHGVRALAGSINPAEPITLSLYAVVGAAAFLSGSVRYKSTAILIAAESTGAWFLIVPIAVAGERLVFGTCCQSTNEIYACTRI